MLEDAIARKYNRCLYVGRFQPIHRGHVEVIKWSLKLCKELIIVVGSAQYSHTIDNPFTAGERIEMIRLSLRDEKIDLSRVIIIPVPDINSNSIWVKHVESLVPRFDAVISRNPLVVRLFKEAGYEVIIPPEYDRSRYSATRIRELMLKGNSAWRKLVEPSVADFIESIDGISRLREVASHD